MTLAASDVKPRPPSFPSTGVLGLAVATLTRSAFTTICADLIRIVEGDFDPGLVIGIRTGGLIVANAMARAGAGTPMVVPITCRRPSTTVKARVPMLRRVLSSLPPPMVDLMRRVEHQWLIAPTARKPSGRFVDPGDVAAVAEAIDAMSCRPSILVVDDAVDSGATLLAVLNTLRRFCPPEADIRTAAVTQTLAEPMVRPDYVIFRGVLCRFPWSFDATD
jgi:adenine/guanine phosphoribosyltransferase-like PRPP-binding protein